jgi:branched-chain amino acid transport system permease protein
VLVISPSDLGFFVSLNYIIFLPFGGLQTMWGPVVGAVLLTVLPEALRFTKEYRLIVYGAIIVAVVLWRPDGLIRRQATGVSKRVLGMTFGRRLAVRKPATAEAELFVSELSR